MNWVPLKKYHIHLIDREVDKVISMHHQIRESIMEGDILSVQKISDLELSIKKRIADIDEFYNKNCLDQRVKFLNGPRMKLFRLLSNSIINEKDKEFTLSVPLKKRDSQSGARNSTSNQRKSGNERKNEDTSRSNISNQAHKSPLTKQNQQKEKPSHSKKPNITLQIPDETSYENTYSFSPNSYQKQKTNIEQNASKIKTGRKTQRLPVKTPTKKTLSPHNVEPIKIETQQKYERKGQNQSAVSPANNTSQPSSRSRVTNVSARTKTLNSSNNASSMKKLNDLIFTIKMTKEEYHDFMQIKKNLDRDR